MQSLLFAQPASSEGGVDGRVRNSVSGAFLGNVSVEVEGTRRITATDENGFFKFTGLPAGETRVRAVYVGLAPQTIVVDVIAGQDLTIEFSLAPAGVDASSQEVVLLDRYEVIEQREQDAIRLALNQQRQSPNIKNVVSYDEYPTGSEDNLADFIRYIPGISIGYSGKAGVSASVRGLPPETSGITLDGVELAGAPIGDTRAVGLLAVPTSNISTIEVTKVPTPDMSANGLGGSINITTRSGFERTKALFSYNVFTSFNPKYGVDMDERPGPHSSMDSRPIRPSFDLYYVYPINKSLAISLSLGHKLNYNTTKEAEANFNQVKGFQTSSSNRIGTQLVTVRSARLGVDWKIGRKNIFNASVTYRGREADQGSNGVNIAYGTGATGDATHTQGRTTNPASSTNQTYSWQNLVNHTLHSLLKYRHLGDGWRLDGSASYSYSSFYFKPSFQRNYFGSASLSRTGLMIRGDGIDGTATRAEDLNADTLSVKDKEGKPVNLFDPSYHTINNGHVWDRETIVRKAQARLDFRKEFYGRFPFTIQMGIAVNQEVQKRLVHDQQYLFRSKDAANVRTVGNYDLINTTYSNYADPVLGGKVQWLDLEKLYNLYQEHPEYFSLNAPLAHQTRVNNGKKLEEIISAGYLRFDTRLFNNRLWLVAGVRYERTDDDGFGSKVDPAAQYRKNPDGSLARTAEGELIPLTTDPLGVARLVYTEHGRREKTTYEGFYPSLNASYSFSNDLVLRFGYARTIGRPNLPYIVPGVTYAAITELTSVQTITVINSRLKPWQANNYDLSLEAYLIKGGFGSVSFFQKDLKNFFIVETFEATPELLEELGLHAAAGDEIDYRVVTRGNGGDARVRGFEFTYRQSLLFLPHWARGLQVFANYTYSDLEGSAKADFSGFNPETLSWGVNLIRPRFSIKFSSAEQDETRRSPVAASSIVPADTYLWQGKQKRYTLSVEYGFSRHFRLYASWSDFNTPGGYVDMLKQHNDSSTPASVRTKRILEWGQSLVIGIKGQF